MSKTKLRHASYSIKKLFDRANLSYTSKSNYKDMLNLCVRQLDQCGYQIDHINQLKQKHLKALIKNWQENKITVPAIKNRLSALRYACNLMGKQNVVFSNRYYGIQNATSASEKNRAANFIDINKIYDPYVKMSLELQKQFGLRREESIKFIPAQADKTKYIELKASWTKGGIRRLVPITTKEQRDCLDCAKKLCGTGSLIPQNKTYIEQRTFYDHQTQNAGLKNLHALRHKYAQNSYLELTNQFTQGHGWRAPKDGGRPIKQLNEAERKIDHRVREIISSHLGHCRTEITKVYLG